MKSKLAMAFLSAMMLNAAHAVDVDTPVATQGGVSVTIGDLDGFMRHIPEDKRAGFFSSPTRINQMVIGLLRNKQMANQAIALKLDNDPAVKAQIAYATAEILATARLEAFTKSLKVPSFAASAKEQYQTHKSDYVVKETIGVQHVLISLTGRVDADAKKLAEKVRQEAMANPAQFDALVEKYSDDPSKAANIGHINDATAKEISVPFAAAARNLKKRNEISPAVKTPFGYHILKLDGISPARQMEFAEVKDKLEASLRENYIAEQRKAFLASLDEATPEVNPQFMEIMQQRYLPGRVAADPVKPAQ